MSPPHDLANQGSPPADEASIILRNGFFQKANKAMSTETPILTVLRQLLVPREFRIAKSAWPAQLRERLAKAIDDAMRAATESARSVEAAAKAQEEAAKRQGLLPPDPDNKATLQERLKFLADVG